MQIPEKLNRFNVYVGDVTAENKILGITDEVTLPDFSYMSETVSYSGMAGEVDSPSPGQLQSATIEITFANISKEGMAMAADDSQKITMKAAQEITDSEDLSVSFVNRTVEIKGRTKSINYGRLKKGGFGNPSITKEVIYYKETLDGDELTEIDKYNGKCKINGEDVVSNIDDLI